MIHQLLQYRIHLIILTKKQNVQEASHHPGPELPITRKERTIYITVQTCISDANRNMIVLMFLLLQLTVTLPGFWSKSMEHLYLLPQSTSHPVVLAQLLQKNIEVRQSAVFDNYSIWIRYHIAHTLLQLCIKIATVHLYWYRSTGYVLCLFLCFLL